MTPAIRAPGLAVALALAAMPAGPAGAQEDVVPDAAGMDALAAMVPPQSWYPEGYYDLRIAAEAQVAEAPRSKNAYVGPCAEGGGLCYDPFDPLPQRINPGESDPALRRYGNIALDMSRLRQELALTGYPIAVYSGPIADYERQLVEAPTGAAAAAPAAQTEAARRLAASIEANRKRDAPDLPRVIGYDEAAAMAQVVVLRSVGPSAAVYPAGKKLSRDATLVLRADDRIELVGVGGSRTLNGPGTFRAGVKVGTVGAAGSLLAVKGPTRGTGAVRGGGGGGPGGVVIQTSPPSGEVLLVSAFAFKLCVRKQSDPWDRFACKWNEVETGVAKPLAGRFVYQVRWPDGVVRKGTREIDPAEAVTFKKVGS